MNFTVGFAELIGFGITLVGGGWTLLKLSLNQFEKRLDERFKLLDTAVQDVKRLELEIVRSDTRNAQLYITRSEQKDVLERIFGMLNTIEHKLDAKVDARHCDIKHQQ